MPPKRTYVIGHRNPDTDSICSAIAYARLRQRQGASDVEPARAGNLNRQTEFALQQFGVEAPRLLTDVHPRIEDIIKPSVVTISEGTPLAEALQLLAEYRIRMLPVVDGEGRPSGLLVLKDSAEQFLIPQGETSMRRITASVASLCRCLKAELICGEDLDAVAHLNLYIGAMASATFHERIAGVDPRSMVLVTGNRENIQLEGAEIAARILIVTGGMAVPPQVLEVARRNGVAVLSTPYDTATTAWLSRLATPVETIAKKGFVQMKLRDRVDDLRLQLLHSKEPGVIVVDGDGRVAGIATKSNLLAPSPVSLVLVDHNELGQAVAGADKVEIAEIIDHHRLGNLPTDRPIRFINQPIGSTCSVVATLYRQADIEPEADCAGLLLSGLLSDTVILKSPTTTDIDRELAPWLADLAGREFETYGRALFEAGSTLSAEPDRRALVLTDYKEFAAGDKEFGIGQVEVVSFEEFYRLKGDLGEVLAQLQQERGLLLVGLLVTDIVAGNSLLLAMGGRELPLIIGYPQLEADLYELKGVLSRKKQLIPHLLKVLGC